MIERINGRREGERRGLPFREFTVWLEREEYKNARPFNQSINQSKSIKHQLITPHFSRHGGNILGVSSTQLKDNRVHFLSLDGNSHTRLHEGGVLSWASIRKIPQLSLASPVPKGCLGGRQGQCYDSSLLRDKEVETQLFVHSLQGQNWDWSPQCVTPPLPAGPAESGGRQRGGRQQGPPGQRPGGQNRQRPELSSQPGTVDLGWERLFIISAPTDGASEYLSRGTRA